MFTINYETMETTEINKTGKFDPIPAGADHKQRTKIMREEAYKKRKSPDIEHMYGIRTYLPYTEYYFQSASKRNRFLNRINEKYDLIEPK